MHSFVSGLLGGALIGVAASVLLLFSGDILGASGIVSSTLLSPLTVLRDPCQHWKLVLLASFFLTAHLFFSSGQYQDKQDGLATLSWTAYLIGGFFVGFGTRLGNGCTSGHGICGLARFSKRSLAAVMTFMSVGIVTAYLTQATTSPFKTDVFGFLRTTSAGDDVPPEPIAMWTTAAAVVTMVLSVAAFVAPSFYQVAEVPANCRTKLAPALCGGVLFALGLYISQMVYPIRVFGFLNLGLLAKGEPNWDATLMFVMGGGCAISFLSYQLVEGYNFLLSHNYIQPLNKPLALSEGSNFCVPTNSIIDRELIVGAMSFGLGWGISGLCPGPAMFLAAIGVSWVLVCYWPAYLVGAYLASLVKEYKLLSSCCSSRPSEEAAAAPTACDTGADKHDEHSNSSHLEKTAPFDLEDINV